MQLRSFPHTSVFCKIIHGIIPATKLLDIPDFYITITKLQHCCACSASSTKTHKYTIPKHKLQSQNTMFSIKVHKLPDLYVEYNCGVKWCKLLTQLKWVCCLAWVIVPPWTVVCSGARRIGSPQESRQFRWLSTNMLPMEARH
jgi:hypothetical protein